MPTPQPRCVHLRVQNRGIGFFAVTAHGSGRSSGVEHNLAKVRVARSIRVARSNFLKDYGLLVFQSYPLFRHPQPRHASIITQRKTACRPFVNAGGRRHVQVRRNGFKPVSKSILTRKNAERWAAPQERLIDVQVASGVNHLPRTNVTAREWSAVIRPKSCLTSRAGIMKRIYRTLSLYSIS